jgi:hypothetical protein
MTRYMIYRPFITPDIVQYIMIYVNLASVTTLVFTTHVSFFAALFKPIIFPVLVFRLAPNRENFTFV